MCMASATWNIKIKARTRVFTGTVNVYVPFVAPTRLSCTECVSGLALV